MGRFPLLMLAVLVSACTTPPPNVVTAPSSTPAVPARIVLTAMPGIGNGVTSAALGATVTDSTGLGIGNVPVTFTTTGGTLTHAIVVTDAGGLAQNTLTAVKPATITASAAGLSTSILAAINADLVVSVNASAAVRNSVTTIAGFVQQSSGAVSFTFDFGDGSTAGPGSGSTSHVYTQAGIVTLKVSAIDAAGRSGATTQPLTVTDPAPPPPVPPSPPPPPAVLAITLECTPAAHAGPTGCHVAMTGADGSALTSTITSTDWDWGDGSKEFGVIVPTPAEAMHTYAVAGTFLVIAKAHAPAGTATNSTMVKIP